MSSPTPWSYRCLLYGVLLVTVAGCAAPHASDGEWRYYGRTALGDRHSPVKQITKENISSLAVAWRYHTGESRPDAGKGRPPRFSATPIMANDNLYFSTPLGRVVALNASTGRELWTWNAKIDTDVRYGDFTSRGVAYWEARNGRARNACNQRVFAAVIDGRLIALDAASGQPCGDFGDKGTVDLRQGLRNPPADPAEYQLTSPPTVVGDVVVTGSAIADNGRINAASGEVRGLDARSGKLLWRWDPIPQDPADPHHASWVGPDAHRTGGANTWSVMAADPARNMVFLPTSSPSVDYWGGARLGNNQNANSIVALDVRTGRKIWSFQTVHHDLWDYDNAAPPVLVDVTINGQARPALVYATKTGQLFVLDRLTGEPLYPVEEKPVPRSDATGEEAASTQPFSSLPPLSPLALTEADIRVGITDPIVRERCLTLLASLRNDGPFTPPSSRGSLVYPSNIGGAHWGGAAYDPDSGIVVTPVNRIAAVIRLVPRSDIEAAQRADQSAGERLGLEYAPMIGSPYILKREFFASQGAACTPPPYGSLHAISLKTGKTVWNVPLGTGEGLPAFAGQAPIAGMLNLGGPISTASGLIFIGAAPDAWFRAFNIEDGRELWKAKLPAGARSTPMTYVSEDRQFVVIAAGGDGELFGWSDELVAFALTDH